MTKSSIDLPSDVETSRHASKASPASKLLSAFPGTWKTEVGTWTLTGHWQFVGKSTPVRCTTVFSPDGNTMTSKWEYSTDGSQWQTFWDIESTKTQGNAEMKR